MDANEVKMDLDDEGTLDMTRHRTDNKLQHDILRQKVQFGSVHVMMSIFHFVYNY